MFQQFIYQVIVELESLHIDGIVPAAIGNDSRPRDGEAVRVDTKLGKYYCQLLLRDALTSYVFLVSIEMPTRSVDMRAVTDLAGGFTELVPNLPNKR